MCGLEAAVGALEGGEGVADAPDTVQRFIGAPSTAATTGRQAGTRTPLLSRGAAALLLALPSALRVLGRLRARRRTLQPAPPCTPAPSAPSDP